MAGKYPKSGPDLHLERKMPAENRNTGTLQNPTFLKACSLAGVEPTKRQASKYNHSKGLAYAQRFEAKRITGGQ